MTRPLTQPLRALALCLTFAVCAARAADSPPPLSAEGDIDRHLSQCLDDPAQQSTSGQDECIVRATQAWDARLNVSYRALQHGLPEAARPVLVRAQRAWLASRDADIRLIGAVYATARGTVYAPMNANDVMTLTQRRAQALTRYVAAVGAPAKGAADLAGPLPPANIVRGERGGPVPQRGMAFERDHCASLTDMEAIGRCAGQAAVRYDEDIASISSAIQRRLPAASRGAMRASDARWRDFVAAEGALVDVVCPTDATAQAQACRSVHQRNAAVERLRQLVGLNAVIGAD